MSRAPVCVTVTVLLLLCLVGPALAVEYSSTDTPLAITDLNYTRSSITITGAFTVTDIDVCINISHSYVSDLDITLISPYGQSCRLVGDTGGNGDNFTDTRFDDEAAIYINQSSAPFTGSFRPQSPLSVYDGGNSAGTWTLQVYDDASGDEGALLGWCLILQGAPDDDTPPTVLISSVHPTTLWPPNGKNRTIELCGNIYDAESALAVTQCVVEDEYGDCDGTYTLTCDEDGDFYTQLSLPAFRYEEDMDGRVFDVTIYAEDTCGNDASETIQIVVPHDMGRMHNQPPPP